MYSLIKKIILKDNKVKKLFLAMRSFFQYVREVFQKTKISYPLILTRECAYHGVTILVFRKIFERTK